MNVLGTAGGGGPSNTIVCYLQGPKVRVWLRFVLLCRLWLWLFRVRGGFVCRFRWFEFVVNLVSPRERGFVLLAL